MSSGSGVLAADVAVLGGTEVAGGWIRFEGGVITDTGSGASPFVPDARGEVLLPGFVDQHCHGGGGGSFASADPDQIATAVAAHRDGGTTSLIASLVSAAPRVLPAQLRALADAADDDLIAGIHLEGPWLSRARCGAHDPAVLRPPDATEIASLLAAGRGWIRQVTLAPELPGALAAIRQLTAAGVRVALGHTDADHTVTLAAIDAGATVATHLWNAMPPVRQRAPGPVTALLCDDRVWLELIDDGVHLDPAIFRLTMAVAGGRRVVLVTDAMAAAGAPDGQYRLGDLPVTVRDRVARVDTSGAIAGSTLTMVDAALRAHSESGWTWPAVAAATATNPAQAMDLPDVGRLALGQRADAVLLSNGRPALVLRRGLPVSRHPVTRQAHRP